jgi:Spy/CpxP family protein refolding chaperone
MMKTVRSVLILAATLTVTLPLWAAPKPRAERKPATDAMAQRVAKILDGVTLNDSQKAKVDDLKKEYAPKFADVPKRQGMVLTPEQKKARDDASTAAKAAGKKGRDVSEAVDNAVKITDEQKEQKIRAAMARSELSMLERELRDKILKLLTPEQKDQLDKAKQAKKKGGK